MAETTEESAIGSSQHQIKMADEHAVVDRHCSRESQSLCTRLATKLRKPTDSVDSGWSWVICACSFVIHFVVVGTLASFGVLYTGLLQFYTGSNRTGNYCDTNRNESGISAVTAWIGSQATFLAYLLAPVSASLVSWWGARPITMAGSVLLSAGAFLTAATNEIWQAILTYGVILGVGSSLCLIPVSGILPRYFDKKTSLAVCVARSASWVAGLCMAPINQTILDYYGWRAVCLLIGSYSLLLLVCGLLLRPRVEENKTKVTVKQIAVRACNTQRHIRFSVWIWLVGFHYFSIYLVLYHLVRF